MRDGSQRHGVPIVAGAGDGDGDGDGGRRRPATAMAMPIVAGDGDGGRRRRPAMRAAPLACCDAQFLGEPLELEELLLDRQHDQVPGHRRHRRTHRGLDPLLFPLGGHPDQVHAA